jgi:hypothetical protein
MSQVLELVQDLETQIRNTVAALPEVRAQDLGLDRRSAYTLWVDEDVIIVRKSEDSPLRYYGGFEYVDSRSRIEVGDYVIYTDDDSRVYDCLDYYRETEEA